jgi:hypothetical protein
MYSAIIVLNHPNILNNMSQQEHVSFYQVMSKYSLNRDIERIIENEDTIDNVENGIIQ